MPPIKKHLKEKLRGAQRIAVLGIGSELSGDDAVGVLVAKELRRKPRPKRRGIILRSFAGGAAPENLTGQIRRFKPTHLIMIDAADLGMAAGSMALLDIEKIEGVSFSTHRLPTRILADYLVRCIGCQIIVIGIQPKEVGFGKKLSRPACRCVKTLSETIHGIFLPNA
ncbi:MAG: hydrogenase 3 maturation endopeptidase HyCI [Candidatus Omnitrophica bacterium]|nr:hydrogenase 3 maturation endopeptidase HyCI [Candidatus Omnitrophota bacterium]MDD5574262.1 hydrogenase 3 maturation endopeptidase HyCI [Candidatus Omnitrophota bacterium]